MSDDHSAAPGWAPHGSDPIGLTMTAADRGQLELRLQSAAPLAGPVAAALRGLQAEVDGRLNALLERRPEHGRFLALKAQYDAARGALAAAQAKHREAEGRRQALARQSPPPANLAARLVTAGAEVDAAEGECRARSAELDALGPVYRRAREALEVAVKESCESAYADAGRGWSRQGEAMLAALLAGRGSHLTALAAHLRAARKMQRPKPEEVFAAIAGEGGAPAELAGPNH